MSGKRPLDWAVIIAAALSLAGTLYIEATHTDAEDHVKAMANEHRITALEQSQADESKKVDHIQSQVDRLVEWALGSK